MKNACTPIFVAFTVLPANKVSSLIKKKNSNTMLLLLPANVVSEGYVFTGVCLSTGGGSPSRGGFSIRGGFLHPGGVSIPEGFSICGGALHPGGGFHPVNVRAVRILLECILVYYSKLYHNSITYSGKGKNLIQILGRLKFHSSLYF